MLRVIILKKGRVETANQLSKKNQQTTSYAANQMSSGFSALNKVVDLYATIFPIITCRTSNKMCALLIEVLSFTISSVFIHFSLL
jgi:hypothetical protein